METAVRQLLIPARADLYGLIIVISLSQAVLSISYRIKKACHTTDFPFHNRASKPCYFIFTEVSFHSALKLQ